MEPNLKTKKHNKPNSDVNVFQSRSNRCAIFFNF